MSSVNGVCKNLFVVGRRSQQKLSRYIFAHPTNLPEQTAPYKQYASKEIHPGQGQIQAKRLSFGENGKAEEQEIHQQL